MALLLFPFLFTIQICIQAYKTCERLFLLIFILTTPVFTSYILNRLEVVSLLQQRKREREVESFFFLSLLLMYIVKLSTLYHGFEAYMSQQTCRNEQLMSQSPLHLFFPI